MAGAAGRLIFKLVTAAVAFPISRVVSKSIARAWVAVRPENPPHNPKKVETGWQDALIWALLTGLGSALGQLVTTKGADTLWRAMTGRPSPKPKPPKVKGQKKGAKDDTTIAA